jgi:hypothetical protein
VIRVGHYNVFPPVAIADKGGFNLPQTIRGVTGISVCMLYGVANKVKKYPWSDLIAQNVVQE